MGRVDEYLEKKGIKHLMALVTVLYIVGTIIFNVYLRSLGIFEFELIQLRYIFVGLIFAIFTGIIVGIAYGLWILFRRFARSAQKEKKKTKKQKAKEATLLEIIFLLFLFPWIVGYAFYFFPEIPSGFGGAKPITARLIGEKETIQKVNALIAHETGVAEDKLPFDMISEDTNLAIGANVKILDRNRDRILLILTKELYLSSTSMLAKNLIEAGASTEEMETEETQNFVKKSLLVRADKIESITFSLYEPPEILTKQDLEIASQVLSKEEDKDYVVSIPKKYTEEEAKNAAIVENFIVQQVPEAAPQILEAVKKSPKVFSSPSYKTIAQTPKENPPAPESDHAFVGKEETTPTKSLETAPKDTSEIVLAKKDTEESLESVLDQFIDTKFIDFRAKFYRKSSELHERERFSKEEMLHERFLLAKKITQTFRREYPKEWNDLAEENYLAFGQSEQRFPWKLMEVFRGAESIGVLVERINTTEWDLSEIAKKEEIKALINKQEGASQKSDSDEEEALEVIESQPEENLDPLPQEAPTDPESATPFVDEDTAPVSDEPLSSEPELLQASPEVTEEKESPAAAETTDTDMDYSTTSPVE